MSEGGIYVSSYVEGACTILAIESFSVKHSVHLDKGTDIENPADAEDEQFDWKRCI